jgi:hypothetical protein
LSWATSASALKVNQVNVLRKNDDRFTGAYVVEGGKFDWLEMKPGVAVTGT